MDIFEPIYLQAEIEVPATGLSVEKMEEIAAVGFKFHDFEQRNKKYYFIFNGTIPYREEDKAIMKENYLSLKETGVAITKVYVTKQSQKVEV